MHSDPTVSVALATYNGMQFLPDLLESVLAQSVPVSELVVSDDSSSDGTYEYIVDRAKEDSRIRVLPKHQRYGYIQNFATAIDACSSGFIALCDQDDVWHPNKIERLLGEIGSHDAVASNALVTDRFLRPTGSDLTHINSISPEALKFSVIAQHNRFTGCTILFRSTLRHRLYPFPAIIAHDWWIALLALDGGGMTYVDETLLKYRQHGDNTLGVSEPDLKPLDDHSQCAGRRSEVAIRTMKRIEMLLQIMARQESLTVAGRSVIASLLEYHVLFFERVFSFRRLFLGLRFVSQLPENRSLARRVRVAIRSFVGSPSYAKMKPGLVQDVRDALSIGRND